MKDLSDDSSHHRWGRIVSKSLKVHVLFVTSGPNSTWIQSFVRVSGIGFIISRRVIIKHVQSVCRYYRLYFHDISKKTGDV